MNHHSPPSVYTIFWMSRAMQWPSLLATTPRTMIGSIPRPQRHLCRARFKSTANQFYQNRHLEEYASKEAKRLTLRQLVFFGRAMDTDRLIKSANYVRTELPVRIAHRLRDMQALPYVVVTQEEVAKVYELYWTAFNKLRQYPPINNLTDNDAFCSFLSQILDEHGTVIPALSLGLSLSSPNLPPDALDSFMRRMLVSRISRRVLAEHHIALSEHCAGRRRDSSGEPRVGIIFTGLNVKRSIERCARLLRKGPLNPQDEAMQAVAWPEVLIEGQMDTTFSYIREHLEYIIFELLKNSMQATRKHHPGASILPPIQVTVVAGANDVSIRISDQGGGLINPPVKSPSDLFSFSHIRNSTRMDDSRIIALRELSSSSRGIRATVDEQVGKWNQVREPLLQPPEQNGSTPEKEAGVGSHPSIGIGLPMSNIFATYFGGALEIVSLDCWGTDAYLRLPKLGTNLEGIEL